jgi:hypothetical protein
VFLHALFWLKGWHVQWTSRCATFDKFAGKQHFFFFFFFFAAMDNDWKEASIFDTYLESLRDFRKLDRLYDTSEYTYSRSK